MEDCSNRWLFKCFYLNAFSTCVVQLDILQCDCKSCTAWDLYIQRSLGHVGSCRSLLALRSENQGSLVDRYTVLTDFTS